VSCSLVAFEVIVAKGHWQHLLLALYSSLSSFLSWLNLTDLMIGLTGFRDGAISQMLYLEFLAGYLPFLI